jgi:hypothetical protein
MARRNDDPPNTFIVTLRAAENFRVGEMIGASKDLHGEPISGRVVAIKPGNNIALILVETEDV